MDIVTMKAEVYDHLAEIQARQHRINELNQQIAAAIAAPAEPAGLTVAPAPVE